MCGVMNALLEAQRDGSLSRPDRGPTWRMEVRLYARWLYAFRNGVMELVLYSGASFQSLATKLFQASKKLILST